MLKRLAAVAAAGLTGGVIGLGYFTAPAMATEPEQDCVTVVADIVDRPDSGHNGTWALDTFTRTVTICITDDTDTFVDGYTATGHDEGTFVTIAGATSPGDQGVTIPIEREGTIVGDWTATFVAGANFNSFDDSGANRSDLATGDWIKSLFGTDFEGDTGAQLNPYFTLDPWKWTYTTCNEEWVNASDAVAGEEGDITAVPGCEGQDGEDGKDGKDGEDGEDGEVKPAGDATTLPKTSGLTSLPVLLGAGGLLVLAGVGSLVLARRRRLSTDL